ncbi:hypothetical protein XVE_1408 [Xanthomonas vesicatoria ATCC 35937]|uniref:Uncharacterized protein n=1 Tax=Xanthomonas vesicatoria ATCC 35937 TaxID=925775 RepID=F0BBD8_9XANT|nr:hypothetical protein XVE_1408 [Xanthomonas vesicatoria ATCC 35937]
MLDGLYLSCSPALETPNAICKHLAFAHTHLSNGFLAQIHAMSVAFGEYRSRLFLMVGLATVVSG